MIILEQCQRKPERDVHEKIAQVLVSAVGGLIDTFFFLSGSHFRMKNMNEG